MGAISPNSEATANTAAYVEAQGQETAGNERPERRPEVIHRLVEPKARPRWLGLTESAMSASRGPERIPLPARLRRRAPSTCQGAVAMRDTGPGDGRYRVAACHQHATRAPVGHLPRRHLDEAGQRVRAPLDEAEISHRRAQAGQEHG